MFTLRTTLRRLIFPVLFTIAILAAGCSDDDPTTPPVPGVDISGVVQNPNGGPGAGSTVFLGRPPLYFSRPAAIFFDSVLTNAQGRYEFDKLDQGTYQVYAGTWDPGSEGFSQVSSFSRHLAIPPQSAAKSADLVANISLLEMVDDGMVGGEVFHEDGLSETPADSAMITLYRYEGAEFLVAGETATNAEGEFELKEVNTGNYIVTAEKVMDPGASFPLYVAAESETFFCDGRSLVQVEHLILRDIMVEKPAVYIYPERPGRFEVELIFGSAIRLTASEPEYGDGWNVSVDESGLIDETWDYLFYEIAMRGSPEIAEGWCLSWSELPKGLKLLTKDMGLNAAEQDDFLDYWMPRLSRKNFYEILPVHGKDLDAWVNLKVTPAPDAVLRFWLFFRGSDTAVELTAPRIHEFERTATTVVEWGGAVIP
ncbi:MAG: carboxypeptidase regulatory-like domain-containing protein [Candidatus Krumholzibacteria bacterium]|nr:carboxypeptidase regulatory-like domain-containing protein [Candidatus Krumholzibacteria bacterium]